MNYFTYIVFNVKLTSTYSIYGQNLYNVYIKIIWRRKIIIKEGRLIDNSNSYGCEEEHKIADQVNERGETKDIKLYVEIHINIGVDVGTEVIGFWELEVCN